MPAFLPTRELTLYDASTVSRGWEQKRLRVLYGLGQGKIPVLVTSVEALMLRTVPRQTLVPPATLLLQAGAEYALDELAARLTDAGYARTPMVEGVGQFSLRGGILDVFSPAQDAPIRCEFFGDTLDAMGYFDTVTSGAPRCWSRPFCCPLRRYSRGCTRRDCPAWWRTCRR